MAPLMDLTGQRFSRLVVVERDEAKRRPVYWRCTCDCGASRVVRSQDLRTGHTKSCGCLISDCSPGLKHGWSGSPEYVAWVSMKRRCDTPSCTGFQSYGGRGISVCDRWVHGEGGKHPFECFIDDVGPRLSPAHSIDRINPDGAYEPGNVRWAVKLVQVNNRRNTRHVVYRGERMPLTDAVRAAGSIIHYEAAWVRISQCGWSVERAVETPSSRPYQPLTPRQERQDSRAVRLA